jgi:hypothetical protein
MSEHRPLPTPGSSLGVDDDLTLDEAKIVRALERLAKTWPRNLVLFAGNGRGISLRRARDDGGFYGVETEIAFVTGIRNDGGDGGDRGD